MNLSPRSSRVSTALALSLALAGVWLSSCSPKETGKPPPPPPPAPTPPGLVSAEKTSFREVTAQLDPGGSIYVYLSTVQWLTGLSEKVGGWRDLVLALPDLAPNDRTNVLRVFDVVTGLIRHSGLETVSGVGISGVALEKGFYQTKTVVHHYPGQDSGYLWSLFGAAPHPLEGLDWLPAETAYAGFGDLDLAGLWSAILQEVHQAGLSEAEAGLRQLSAGVQQQTGKTLEQLLGSLAGQQGVFLTLNDSRKISLPLPPGTMFELPEPGLVIALKVKDDTLFDWIDRELKKNPQVISADQGGTRMRTLPVPLPLPVNLRPTVARSGDLLLLGTSDELMQHVVDVKAGKKPGLKTTEEFKKLAQGIAPEGNQFGFVSRRFGDVLLRVQQTALEMSAKQEGAPTALFQKLVEASPPVSSFGVSRNTPEGWFMVAHGNQEPASAVIVPLVVAPVAIMAGMTLPALAKAKDKAQSIQCVNNLKQIGLATRIWAVDHQGAFPPDLLSMTNELVSPKILVCPGDKKVANPADLAWANFTAPMISYQFLLPGAKDGDDLAEKVLARCPIHHHTCMGDGSVRQNQGP